MAELTRAGLRADLERLGLRAGGIVLVHSSFRAIGARDAETVVGALLDVLGAGGTLLFPALTYLQRPLEVHDARTSPSCVGYLSEYFRTRAGTRRSLHPTHSVCGVGARVDDLLGEHHRDSTPCGPCSPFNRLIELGGRILMLGCGLTPMTTMHAVEEHVVPPYLFGPALVYTITDRDGRVWHKPYRTHAFNGLSQRYDRLGELLAPPDLVTGAVGRAACHMLSARAVCGAAVARMREDPFYFVEPLP